MLIELIITSAIMVVVFGSLFLAFQFTLELLSISRAKLSGLSLANDRMEYFRSLPYDSVGVVSGFPAGTIPQTSVLSLNGISFNERVRVDYVNDPADDVAGVDNNGITTDYKQIRLEYQWEIGGETKELILSSFIVPRSIESNVGGGTVRINVLDADSTLLPGATVRLFNSSSTFSYDVTNLTTAAGSALFAVPQDSGYQVEVSANIGGEQYSTARTYAATTTNPNPNVVPFSVAEAGISTLTFQIGALGDLDLSVKSAVVENSAAETFADSLGIALSNDTAVSGGDLVLADTAGVYQTSGIAYLNTTAPSTINSWEVVRVVPVIPATTNFLLRLYTGDAVGGYTPIPDSDLPGNSTGFTDTLIDVSALDVGTYATATIGITLSTSNTSVTPAIEEVAVYWRESDSALASQSFYIQGHKTIGTDASAAPIYKATSTATTNANGEIQIPDLEYDIYSVDTSASLDLARACPAYPIVHQAGIDSEVELLYVANSANTLRVHVLDSLNRSVPGVDVELRRSGYNQTLQTDTCGQVFFTGGPTNNNDYELTVSAPGYATQVVDPVEVNGDTVTTINLSV